MKFKKLTKREEHEEQIYIQIEDDGSSRISCTAEYPPFKEWVAAGNTAKAADPGPTDWDLVREKRDDLLRASDWAMTTGATIDQAQWSAYREKLRDIPQTYKDKETSEIVWPTIPSSKGPNS